MYMYMYVRNISVGSKVVMFFLSLTLNMHTKATFTGHLAQLMMDMERLFIE